MKPPRLTSLKRAMSEFDERHAQGEYYVNGEMLEADVIFAQICGY
jgi:hypothetical protein